MRWVLLAAVLGGCPDSFFAEDEGDPDAGTPVEQRCNAEEHVGNTYLTEADVLCVCEACAPDECTDFFWNCEQPEMVECMEPEDLGNLMTTDDGRDCECIECAPKECPTGTEVRWNCV